MEIPALARSYIPVAQNIFAGHIRCTTHGYTNTATAGGYDPTTIIENFLRKDMAHQGEDGTIHPTPLLRAAYMLRDIGDLSTMVQTALELVDAQANPGAIPDRAIRSLISRNFVQPHLNAHGKRELNARGQTALFATRTVKPNTRAPIRVGDHYTAMRHGVPTGHTGEVVEVHPDHRGATQLRIRFGPRTVEIAQSVLIDQIALGKYARVNI